MTHGGYEAVDDDPYSYRGVDCLKNRLGLRDPETLQAFELEMSTLRAEEPLPSGHFGPTHYQRVHRHLFQDVYGWAGRYRTVRTAKGGNWFCFPEYITAEMDKLFRRLGAPPFLPGSSAADFVLAAAKFLGDLNAVHPFREGNGRSQLAFMYLVGLRADHRLRLQLIKRTQFLPAMIRSFDGDYQPLAEQLDAIRA